MSEVYIPNGKLKWRNRFAKLFVPAIVLTALVVFIAFRDTAENDKTIITTQREGCERQNVLRDALGAVVEGYEVVQQQAERNPDPQLRRTYTRLAERYKNADEALRASTMEQRENGNPYLLDCDKAYPFPDEEP